MIVNNNDMEIILRGSQEQVIRKMLNDRLFCLMKMPIVKPEKCSSIFSSSVFVGRMNDYAFVRSFAVRKENSETVYGDCELYLCINTQRGCDEEKKHYYQRALDYIIRYCDTFTYLTIDELLVFLKDKELVLITNYMYYGNIEALKVKDFLDELLLLRKESGSKFMLRDETCDIRVYLSRIGDENTVPEQGLYLEDVRDFDIRQRIVKLLEKSCKAFYDDEKYYSAEYETNYGVVHAAYYVTRFHSNHQWEADPVNIVNARISAFILPETVAQRKTNKLPKKKKTKNKTTGVDFMIDSIHVNSDCFSDLAEFKDYIESYFEYFMYA